VNQCRFVAQLKTRLVEKLMSRLQPNPQAKPRDMQSWVVSRIMKTVVVNIADVHIRIESWADGTNLLVALHAVLETVTVSASESCARPATQTMRHAGVGSGGSDGSGGSGGGSKGSAGTRSSPGSQEKAVLVTNCRVCFDPECLPTNSVAASVAAESVNNAAVAAAFMEQATRCLANHTVMVATTLRGALGLSGAGAGAGVRASASAGTGEADASWELSPSTMVFTAAVPSLDVSVSRRQYAAFQQAIDAGLIQGGSSWRHQLLLASRLELQHLRPTCLSTAHGAAAWWRFGARASLYASGRRGCFWDWESVKAHCGRRRRYLVLASRWVDFWNQSWPQFFFSIVNCPIRLFTRFGVPIWCTLIFFSQRCLLYNLAKTDVTICEIQCKLK
jgi:hypothetical protein